MTDWLPRHDDDSGYLTRCVRKLRWRDVCLDRLMNAEAALQSAHAEYKDATSAYEAAQAELSRELSTGRGEGREAA